MNPGFTPFLHYAYPAFEGRRGVRVVDNATLAFWTRVADADAPLRCPAFQESMRARAWTALFAAQLDGNRGFVVFEVEQHGAGAQPTGRVGIGILACNPPAATWLDGDVLTIALPLQGTVYCWNVGESGAYDLRGQSWTMSGRTEVEGRLDAPPVRSAARYVAWDDVEPWAFAT